MTAVGVGTVTSMLGRGAADPVGPPDADGSVLGGSTTDLTPSLPVTSRDTCP